MDKHSHRGSRMASIGVEHGIGLQQLGQSLMMQCGCVGMLWEVMEGQQGINLSCGECAYRQQSDCVDSQLINVGVAHDCDGNWKTGVQLRCLGGCCETETEGWGRKDLQRYPKSPDVVENPTIHPSHRLCHPNAQPQSMRIFSITATNILCQ